MMNKNDLIREYILGLNKGKGSNLTIEGEKLYNYNTIIAINKGDTIYLNTNNYSRTTTVNQNKIRNMINNVFSHINLIEVNANEIYNI